MGLIHELGRSSKGGHGNLLQYSCLKNPMDSRAWRAIVHGVTKSQTRLKQLCMHTGICLVPGFKLNPVKMYKKTHCCPVCLILFISIQIFYAVWVAVKGTELW